MDASTRPVKEMTVRVDNRNLIPFLGSFPFRGGKCLTLGPVGIED
jgi:hypothetical protein